VERRQSAFKEKTNAPSKRVWKKVRRHEASVISGGVKGLKFWNRAQGRKKTRGGSGKKKSHSNVFLGNIDKES